MSKVYYHLTKWEIDSICVGKKYNTPEELSCYWQSQLDGSDTRSFDPLACFFQEPLDNIEPEAIKVIKAVLEGLGMLEGLRSLSLELKYSSQLLKEYIFEDIRASEFSQLPSRKRCMFLVEAEEAEDCLRKMGFEGSSLCGYSLIKVEPIKGDSITHRTDAKLLDINLARQPDIADRARKYWQGTSDPIELSEVLLEGSFIIRKIIKTY